MSVILVSFLVFFLLTAAAVGLILLVYMRSRSTPRRPAVTRSPSNTNTGAEKGLSARLVDVLLPVIVLTISVVTVIFFVRLLPGQVAYHFASDGSADRWVGRGLLVFALLSPQFLLALLSVLVAGVMARVGNGFVKEGKARVAVVRGVIGLMSNMIALPQMILYFAMLDIFLYNAYQIHLFPLYIFAVLVMVIGGLIMGIYFLRIIRGSTTSGSR